MIRVLFILTILIPLAQAQNTFDVFDVLSSQEFDITEGEGQIDFPNVEKESSKNLQEGEYVFAEFIAINKVTANSSRIKAQANKAIYFGNVEIVLHKCISKPNLYKTDNFALISLTENRVDDDPKVIFQGWLVADNPAVSTFEHPVYEIFLKSCV